MSKRVNNKRGNHARRKLRYGHPTKVRGASHGDCYDLATQRRNRLIARSRGH